MAIIVVARQRSLCGVNSGIYKGIGLFLAVPPKH